MQVVQGTPFNASSSGVGAVIADPQQIENPIDQFYKAYSIRADYDRRKALKDEAKRQRLKLDLADLDFKTTGIRDKDAGYFLKGKQALENFTTYALLNNVDPEDPKFINEYQMLNTSKKEYEVMVDASVAINKNLVAAKEALEKDPSKYDYKESVKKIKQLYDAPLEEAIKLNNQPLLVPKSFDMVNHAKLTVGKEGIFQPDQAVFKKGGNILERKQLTDNKLAEAARWSFNNAPDFEDYIMGKAEEMQQAAPEQWQTYQKYAQAQTNAGNPMSAEEALAIEEYRPFAYVQDNRVASDPYADSYAREGAKLQARAGAKAKEAATDIDRWFAFYSGAPTVFFEDNGKKTAIFKAQQKVGTWGGPDGSKKDLPNYLLDAQYVGTDAQGNSIIKYKTSASSAAKGKNGVDQDGYITTAKPEEIIYPALMADYGPEGVKAFQEKAKKIKAYIPNTGTFDRKAIENYVGTGEYVNPKQDAKDIEDEQKRSQPWYTPGVNLLNKLFPNFLNDKTDTGANYKQDGQSLDDEE